MGKHSIGHRHKKSFWRKHGLAIALGATAILLTAGITLTAAALFNPYKKILNRASVETAECRLRKNTLSLTFEGDAEGILSCRKALNALRAEKAPHTVEWRLMQNGEEILSGKIEDVAYIPPASSPRVETLGEDITVLKLKYELEQSGLSVEISADPSSARNGKALTVVVHASKDSLERSAAPVPAAIEAVNLEGGGITRCDVLFRDNGTLFAAASYDLLYRDTLFSAQFHE